ncbi:MAG TPA: alpha-amylase family glycosyl hydrolase [Cyclobacteriaceae bacterium]
MKSSLNVIIPIFLAFFFITSCDNKTSKEENASTRPEWDKPRVPDWHKHAVIYEVNLRHYTPEGTFKAFREHLPRLQEMGVDILWLMPIHPVSEKRRKGPMGSPYAVTDYKAVNPDYGTKEDFKALLDDIHQAGMYCLLDWVPNHTGWDNQWIKDHPDWYTKNSEGEITDPLNPDTGEPWGWTDVADLNYDNQDMRLTMINAMSYWVNEFGIDGFRVDVAHSVPVDFWDQCTDSLYNQKPLFMLAEAEEPELRNTGAFIMDYGWEMHHLLNDIAISQSANRSAALKLEQGNLVDGAGDVIEKKDALDIDSLLAKKDAVYENGYQMHFTSNHDENAWAGTEFQRMGDGHKAFAVLTSTFDGMPLIYTGQEEAMDKKLAFFEKDEVPWEDFEYEGFYKTLFDLKERNQALWNGEYGGELVKLKTGNDENIYAFGRAKGEDKVVVVINLSSKPQEGNMMTGAFQGKYVDVFSDEGVNLTNELPLQLRAWEYMILSNQ